jgi:hypothetical protein
MKNINNERTRVQNTIRNTIRNTMTLLVLFCGFNLSVYANTPVQNDFNQALIALQHQWADTNYAKNKKVKKGAFIVLEKKSIELTATYPTG